jgi:hypothetical protein
MGENRMTTWTTQDMLNGLCDVTQVGTEREEATDGGGGTLGTIEDYLAIHDALGGRQFLLEWAKANPAKFYDQLLKILEKTDAIKRAGEQTARLDALSAKDLEAMSSVEIKRLLVDSVKKQ